MEPGTTTTEVIMTVQQLDAVKSLAQRYNSNLDHTQVVHGTADCGPYGLPTGWVHVLVFDRMQRFPLKRYAQQGPEKRVAIEAGVSPEGHVHT
jgi:hypothetical protein